MSEVFSAERLLLNVAEWAAETTSPNAGAGTPAAIGSWWQRQGAYPGAPTEIYLKGQAQDTGWLKQNIVNLNVFNVKDPAFGAVGDGITDDTAAIQAATDAAQAAGGGVVYFPPVNVGAGQFYRLKRTANLGSIMLSNYHNITFTGDGFASKVEMFDDSGAVVWFGFYITNGASRIGFENMFFSGEGVSNPEPTGLGNDAIRIASVSTDPNAGMNQFSITNCWYGGAQRGVAVQADDAAHIVTNLTIKNCSQAATTTRASIEFGPSTAAIATVGFFNDVFVENNWLNEAVNNSTALRLAPSDTDVTSRNFLASGNIVNGAGLATDTGMSWRRGVSVYNIGNGLVVFTSSGTNAGAFALILRGNVVVDTGGVAGANAIAVAGVNTTAPSWVHVVGNVTSKNTTNVISLSGSTTTTPIKISDNVSASLAVSPNNINLNDAPISTVLGNISVEPSNNASAGNGLNITWAAVEVQAAEVAGNLVLAVGANRPSRGILVNINAANMDNVLVNANLTQFHVTGIAFVRTTGLYLNWAACNDNNCAGVSTTTIGLPTTNVGVTQEGPAGPGSQIALNGTTPLANVSAPQGSLCADTAGGQATALWYKETGVGVSGGTAGWLGVGGYDLVFGALNLSTTLTALFLAPGSDGLATPSATEIQSAMTRPATVRNLRSKVAAAGTGAGTVIHTVRKNGVDTALTVTVTNTSTTAVADTTHSFTVVAGDLLSVKITKTATITTAQTNCADTIEIV